MMGCSKRIMSCSCSAMRTECRVHGPHRQRRVLRRSLLHGFGQRLNKGQPLSAPARRAPLLHQQEESGVLCLSSCVLGTNREIFFPKLDAGLHLITFADIASRWLANMGYEAVPCESEDEARARVTECRSRGRWPVYFFDSDTTGEKAFEEFHATDSDVDWNRFADMGVIRNQRHGNTRAGRVRLADRIHYERAGHGPNGNCGSLLLWCRSSRTWRPASTSTIGWTLIRTLDVLLSVSPFWCWGHCCWS